TPATSPAALVDWSEEETPPLTDTDPLSVPRLVGTHDTGRVTAPLPPISEIERTMGSAPDEKDQRARALDAIRRAAIEAAGSDDLLGDEVAARIRARLSDEAIERALDLLPSGAPPPEEVLAG